MSDGIIDWRTGDFPLGEDAMTMIDLDTGKPLPSDLTRIDLRTGEFEALKHDDQGRPFVGDDGEIATYIGFVKRLRIDINSEISHEHPPREDARRQRPR